MRSAMLVIAKYGSQEPDILQGGSLFLITVNGCSNGRHLSVLLHLSPLIIRKSSRNTWQLKSLRDFTIIFRIGILNNSVHFNSFFKFMYICIYTFFHVECWCNLNIIRKSEYYTFSCVIRHARIQTVHYYWLILYGFVKYCRDGVYIPLEVMYAETEYMALERVSFPILYTVHTFGKGYITAYRWNILHSINTNDNYFVQAEI